MIPKVSIIIPCFNAEAYIDQCFTSLLSQSFEDWELICVNDGSTDNSYQCCQKYAHDDNRIKILTQEKSGASVARNKGLSVATGEYVTFVDVDDFVDKDYFTSLDGAVEDLILLQYKSLGTSGDYLLVDNVQPLSSTTNREQIRTYIRDNFHVFTMITPWGKFIKRELLQDVKFPIDQRVGEDSVFIFKVLAKVNSMKAVDNAFYVWRANHVNFIDKYPLDTDTAIRYLVNTIKAYHQIGIKSSYIENILYMTFYTLSEKERGRYKWRWFSHPAVINIWKNIGLLDDINTHKAKFKKYGFLRFFYSNK